MSEADTGGACALLDKLRDRIRRHGPLRIDAYMQACLGDPEHGYYRRTAPIGASGDFITAPEISQVFGELIGAWCAVCWQGMGAASPVRLVELGPGRGTLMSDALRASRAVPQFLDAASVHLVEVSAPLRDIQQRTLASSPHPGGRIAWHEALQDVPSGPAIVVANEFLDALPIRQLVLAGGGWRERVVELDAQGALCFGLGDVVDCDLDERGEPGAIAELRPGEDDLLAELARRGAPVTALFIDYGPENERHGDTLQAVRRHAYANPLEDPGRADLTAHVQFGRLARKARRAGFAVDGPMTQASFLAGLGIVERASRLMAANPGEAGTIEGAVQRLISPTGMGALCKVLAVRSPELPPPPPFG